MSPHAEYSPWQRQHDVRPSVAFLIGSGMTFDDALERAGVPRSKTWALATAIPTVPAGRFAGPLVVTMRCMTPAQAVIACQLTGRFPLYHGAPIHMGDPAAIGADLEHPLFGEPVRVFPPLSARQTRDYPSGPKCDTQGRVDFPVAGEEGGLAAAP